MLICACLSSCIELIMRVCVIRLGLIWLLQEPRGDQMQGTSILEKGMMHAYIQKARGNSE